MEAVLAMALEEEVIKLQMLQELLVAPEPEMINPQFMPIMLWNLPILYPVLIYNNSNNNKQCNLNITILVQLQI